VAWRIVSRHLRREEPHGYTDAISSLREPLFFARDPPKSRQRAWEGPETGSDARHQAPKGFLRHRINSSCEQRCHAARNRQLAYDNAGDEYVRGDWRADRLHRFRIPPFRPASQSRTHTEPGTRLHASAPRWQPLSSSSQTSVAFLAGRGSPRDHGNSHQAAARPIQHFGTQLLHAAPLNNGDAI
jgi:hypothetical protein